MAYDETLATRIRDALAGTRHITEKRMFGGLAFLSRGHMFIGLSGNALMARVGPDAYEAALARKHVREMDFTGRPMRGYVFVDAPGLRTARELHVWVSQCLAFADTLPDKSAR